MPFSCGRIAKLWRKSVAAAMAAARSQEGVGPLSSQHGDQADLEPNVARGLLLDDQYGGSAALIGIGIEQSEPDA
jgi:hypothetical protein